MATATDRHADPLADPLADRFALNFDGPAPFDGHPRLWRLLLGVACLLGAVLLPVSDRLSPWWNLATMGDIHVAAGVLGLIGFLTGFRALSSDLFRLHSAAIDARGVLLHWSHAPTLLGPALSEQRFVPWSEVAGVVWREGHQEHEFRQLLDLEFAAPLEGRRHRVSLPFCEGRQVERCQSLLRHLPAGSTLPDWVRNGPAQGPAPGPAGWYRSARP